MIIDFHTHIFPSFFRTHRKRFFPEEPAFELLYSSRKSKLVGRKELLRNMDDEGIQRSVVFGFPWQKADFFRRHNDYITESVQRHPERFTGFCCFAPLSQQSSKEAERCLQLGLSGVGELAIYRKECSFMNMGALRDIMDVCLHFDAPLLLHTNEPVGHDYPGKIRIALRELYGFLMQYPSNRIVLAHWGGGLLFYALMKREVGEVLKNVWFDTAASPYLYSPSIYRIAGEIIGFDKILFGSDYPLLTPGRYFEEMASANLSPQAIRKIAGENAARLLRLYT
jgi:predicted TIM-barrel fold metal-dependent hydrolase